MASIGDWYVPFRNTNDVPSLERNWTSLEEFLNKLAEISGLRILGRRDCVTDPLPPDVPEGSNAVGDAYICDASNDLWVWDGEEWNNTGPWGTSEHDQLTDVTTSQHHVRYTDQEAQDANPPAAHHFVQSIAPANPVQGDVWTNPNAPPELDGPRVVQVISMDVVMEQVPDTVTSTVVDLSSYGIVNVNRCTATSIVMNTSARRSLPSLNSFSTSSISVNFYGTSSATAPSSTRLTIVEYDRQVVF
jgi:hypothetical protein